MSAWVDTVHVSQRSSSKSLHWQRSPFCDSLVNKKTATVTSAHIVTISSFGFLYWCFGEDSNDHHVLNCNKTTLTLHKFSVDEIPGYVSIWHVVSFHSSSVQCDTATLTPACCLSLVFGNCSLEENVSCPDSAVDQNNAALSFPLPSTFCCYSSNSPVFFPVPFVIYTLAEQVCSFWCRHREKITT